MKKGRVRFGTPSLYRAILQLLAWLPVSLGVAEAVSLDWTYGWLAVLLGAALLGAATTAGRFLSPWIVYGLLVATVVGAAIYLNGSLLLPALYLGVVAWRSGRPLGLTAIGMAGVATNGVALVAAHWAAALSPYRPLFIGAGIFWFVLSVYAGHSRLLDSASLHNGIVTRIVTRSTRAYATVLIAAVLAVFLATSDFHLWRAIVDFLSSHAPKGRPPVPEPPPEAPPALPDWMDQAGGSSPGRWAKILNTVFYVIAGIVAAVLAWLLVRRFLLNLEWVRQLSGRIRAFLARLFARPAPAEAPAYADERESLLDIGKALRQAAARWRGRPKREPLSREEWERLDGAGRVRRLYEEAVASGIEDGYGFRPSDTPDETLEKLAKWREAHPGRKAAGPAAAAWLGRVREALGALYGKARYGPREAIGSEREIAELANDYPWKKTGK